MIPPRPIGNSKLDLEQTGNIINNAQHGRSNRFVTRFNEITGKIEHISVDDPRAQTPDAVEAATGEHVFSSFK